MRYEVPIDDLVRRRERAGLTQRSAAKLFGVSPRTYFSVEDTGKLPRDRRAAETIQAFLAGDLEAIRLPEGWILQAADAVGPVVPPAASALMPLTPADQKAMEQAVAEAYGHVVSVNFVEKPGRWLMTAVLSDGRIYRAERSPEGTVTVVEQPSVSEMESRALVHKMRAAQRLGIDPALVARRLPAEDSPPSIDSKKDPSEDLPAPKSALRLGPMLNTIASKIEPVAAEGGRIQVGLTLTPDLNSFMEAESNRLGIDKSAFTRWLIRIYRELEEKKGPS